MAVPARSVIQLELPARGYRHDGAMLYDFSLMARGLRGYLWVFPVHDDRINVGLMHYPSRPLSGGELTRLLAEGLAGLGIRPEALETALHTSPEGVTVITSCSKGEESIETDRAVAEFTFDTPGVKATCQGESAWS